jgi:nicotinamidase-related amidase
LRAAHKNAVLFVGAALGVALSFWSFRQIGKAAEKRAQTDVVIRNGVDLLSALKDAETGQRGYRQGDYETWKYIAPIQKAAWSHKTFENGTWGGEIRSEFTPQTGEIVAQEHWCSSGFANTDLDLQLKKHGIQKLIIIGLIAHTCVEGRSRPLEDDSESDFWPVG